MPGHLAITNRNPSSLPVLPDLEGPLPLEVLGLVVVSEEGGDGVGPPLHQAGGRVLQGGQVRVQLLPGGGNN